MFTGIIETLGTVTNVVKEQENVHLTIKSTITNELKVDQSVAHNGVCLTVVNINNDEYTVTAIKETLDKTNIGTLKKDTIVNLERAMKLGDRLDGHIVQGHVDETGICKSLKDENGSTVCTFSYNSDKNNITIEKGSITINGVSLTVVNSKKDEFSVAIIPYTWDNTTFKTLQVNDVVNSKKDEFSVAIIPYTWDNTTFKTLQVNDVVNLEFDVIGKYVARLTIL